MKKMIAAVLFALIALALQGCGEGSIAHPVVEKKQEGANHAPAVPPYADIEHFPVIATRVVPKSVRAQYELEAKLKLRPVVLGRPLRALNHYRQDNSWRYEEIDVGTVVLVDRFGTIRYKADCWNRLVVEPEFLDRVWIWFREVF